MIKWGLILLHFSVQPETKIRSNKFHGERLKPNVTSSLDETALGGSEFPITRSLQAQTDFALVWGAIYHGEGWVGLENSSEVSGSASSLLTEPL